MTHSWDLLSNLKSEDVQICYSIKHDKTSSAASCLLTLISPIGKTSFPITFDDVLVVPSLQKNLLSASAICKKGAKVVFSSDFALVYYDDKVVLKAIIVKNGLYKVLTDISPPTSASALVHSVSLQTWHEHMGHLSEPEL